MRLTERITRAFRSRSNGRPEAGQVVFPRAEESVRDYPSAGLTPSKLSAILREADDGSLATAMQLFEEMEEKDAHLFAVAQMRRLALTGLDWRIISAADVPDGVDRRLADEATSAAPSRYVGFSLSRLADATKSKSGSLPGRSWPSFV